MKQIARKIGIAFMLAAAFTVAGHIFQHCVGYSADTLTTCSVCQSISGASVHAAPPAAVELVFLRDAFTQSLPGYSSSPINLEQSRAPPVLFS